MGQNNYSPKYFYDSLPEWKRKKDPILSRFFYRPVSFVCASACVKLGVSANTVSYFSGLLAVIACALFLFGSHLLNIVGAVLINVWLILDCTDGDLARSVKKQPFGEFADGISSYALVALMCTSIGVASYNEGGFFISPGWHWIILIGALASTSDTLMRLVYQKYKATEREMADKGIVQIEKDIRTDHAQVGSLRVRVEAELGVGGLLPVAILLAAIFSCLDLIVFYCFFYYGASFLLATFIYVRKAINVARNVEYKE